MNDDLAQDAFNTCRCQLSLLVGLNQPAEHEACAATQVELIADVTADGSVVILCRQCQKARPELEAKFLIAYIDRLLLPSAEMNTTRSTGMIQSLVHENSFVENLLREVTGVKEERQKIIDAAYIKFNPCKSAMSSEWQLALCELEDGHSGPHCGDGIEWEQTKLSEVPIFK